MTKTKTPLHIAILTQETGDETPRPAHQQDRTLYNRSIQLLIKSLEKEGHNVTLIPFLNYIINPEGKLVGPSYIRSNDANGAALFTRIDEEIEINPQDCDMVLLRTWGNARDIGLQYYEHFLNEGVKALNNPDAVKLSYSKIALFEFFSEIGLAIPETITERNPEGFGELLEKAKQEFGRYFVIKGEVGTQADSICFIDMEHSEANKNISEFLDVYQENLTTSQSPDAPSKKGLVIQEYIPTHIDVMKSNYIRVNLVNGELQSAVLFTGEYDGSGKLQAGKRIDTPYRINKPLQRALERLSRHPYFSSGVWGIDILKHAAKDEYYVLEINDGPAVSHVVEIGKPSGYVLQEPYKKCQDFANAYAGAVIAKGYGVMAASALKPML